MNSETSGDDAIIQRVVKLALPKACHTVMAVFIACFLIVGWAIALLVSF